MLPEFIHLLLSLLVGYFVYRLYKRKEAFISAILGGFLIDIDHLFDYFFFYKKSLSFSLQEFLSGHYFKILGQVHVFFHSYELVVVFLIAYLIVMKHAKTKDKQLLATIFLALSLAMLLHISFDILHNHINWQAFSLINRIHTHFDIRAFGRAPS